MMTPAERVKVDPLFHMLVHQFLRFYEEHCGTGAGITPTEIREASGFAYQIYMERHAAPMVLVRPQDAP